MNYIGAWTLYKKEVTRFLKVYNQTLLSPVISSLIYLAIFSLILGEKAANHNIFGVPYTTFIASGLIIMAAVQNAYANTSTTLVYSKFTGIIVDYIIPPLSPLDITFAFIGGGITRGVIIGIVVSVALNIFVPLSFYNIFYSLFHLIAASMLLSLLGLITGILSENFEHTSAINSYLITPLSFLSGTFYSIKHLPDYLYNFCHFNPFFYMIDGFRYGLTGYHEGNLKYGIIILSSSIAILTYVTYKMFKSGYRIKS
jgi:ABC-2 type transport system permease protein